VKRARWLPPFAALLLAATAVPVLADSPGEGPASGEAVLVEAEPVPFEPPGADDLAAALAKLESEEEARARELRGPAAVAEREASRTAFRSMDSAAEAGDLLRAVFSSELGTLELDPARVLSDAALKRNLDGEGAVIETDGRRELVEAEIPAKVADESGEPRKVDLSLAATAGGFAPENPIVDLHIASSAAQGVAIEGGETTIAQVGADPQSTARPLGEKDAIYPEVQTDTDLVVAPLSHGVELFNLLRSPASPETLRFELDVPAGAELRENAGSVEIHEGEKFSAAVMPPYALDAQGTFVPVQLELEGTSLVLSLAHRGGDYAYPILLDPEYVQNDWVNAPWYGGNNYHVLEGGAFQTWWNNAKLLTSKWCINHCWGSGRGLFVTAPSGSYPGNQQAHWTYTPPGETSFLSGYLINPFFRWDTENQACWSGPHPNPHDFDGLWSPTYQVYYQLYTNRALYTNAAVYGNTAKTAKVMVFGLNTGNSANNPCWRDLYAGGIATYMSDPDYPTLDPPTGFPSGWFDDSKTYSFNVSAHDKGLGVKNIWLVKEGTPITPLEPNDCLGTFDSPCYRDMSGPIHFSGDIFDEGKTQVAATAHDALARPANSASWWAHVDNLPPKVTLSGQLAAATNEGGSEEQPPGEGDELSLPVYNLKIEATDGSNASNKEMRSGVKAIKVLLDEDTEPLAEWTQSCPASSCAMTKTFQLKLHDLAPGQHTLRVIAIDQLDHKRERKIEFEYIPATGMKDSYAMHYFPLPDGLGDEDEEEFPDRPELAVNLMNGNLVYREQDVEVEGPAVDLEVERYYNSQLPESENTEWGDGWTLAQTPELEPEEGAGPPTEAELLDQSGALQDGVELPTEVGEEAFDPALRATLTKEAGGGYELADATGESATAVVFDENGRTEELRSEGHAKVAYDYEGGELAEIAVDDPAAASEAEPPPLPEPLPDPVAAYGFDEGEGAVLHDSSEGGHDGAISGAAWSANGRYGGALDFDGQDDVVTVPDHDDLDLTDSFTIEAWVRPENLGTIIKPVLSKLDPSASNVGYALRARHASSPAGHVKDSEGALNVLGEEALPTEAWSHLAFTSDGEELRLYVDGELVRSNAAKLPAVSTADLRIGGHGVGSSLYFDGLIDEVRLYEEPLSETQIAALGDAEEEEELTEPDDPSVAIETDEGLVASLEGVQAGEHTYEHDGELLSAHEGPEGETAYEYDEAGRMTKVTLANDTWAEIAYDETYGRVKSVTVDPAGEEPAKTTHFEFSDEPRRTIVTPPGEPVVTYDIGPDGSILKWWNAIVPPEIHLTGSIDFNKETQSPISTGLHNLVINAYSAHGIKSIQLVAGGNTLVDEMSCEQDLEEEGVECTEELNEWVTETQNHAPGILHLEAIAEDTNEKTAAERLWVNIPEPPPPPPDGAPVAPTFSEILDFREEFGLDVVDPVVNEEELNDRIFNLINAWTTGDSVARATMERWGVPLRTRDVAELEYREGYLRHNAALISQWGHGNAPSTYAGFYMDHRAGGKIRVGFTNNQAATVAELKLQPGIDPDDRIATFPFTPTRSMIQLTALSQTFSQAASVQPEIMQLLTTGYLDIAGNAVSIGATNVGTVESFIAGIFGEAPGISVHFDSSKPVPKKTYVEEGKVRVRERNNRLYAGDWIHQGPSDGGCTLSSGAWERRGARQNGSPIFANYALTAGHCYSIGTTLKRGAYVLEGGKRVEEDTQAIGKVERRSYTINHAGFTTDAEAIRLGSETELPRWLYWSENYQRKIHGVAEWIPGMTLCHSGTWGGSHCGPSAPWLVQSYYGGAAGPMWLIRVFSFSTIGDSGSPVFDPITGSAIGILSGGPNSNSGPTDVTPLLSLEGKPFAQEVAPGTAPGALGAPGMTSPNKLTIVNSK